MVCAGADLYMMLTDWSLTPHVDTTQVNAEMGIHGAWDSLDSRTSITDRQQQQQTCTIG